MVANLTVLLFTFSSLWISSYAVTQVGLIIKPEDEAFASIIEHVLHSRQSGDRYSDIRILKEVIHKEDTPSYQKAVCRLLDQGIVALVAPAAAPHYSILSSYSYDYLIPFITTELPEVTSFLTSPVAVGIRPSTTRAILGLFQLYSWKDVVYIYDHEYGPENLQLIFLLGYRVLNLTLDGILMVASAEEANKYLQTLDKSYNNKIFHVILDMDPNMARDVIWRHKNDVEVRKHNFHFVISQPTPDYFWASERAAFGAANVTTFIFANQLPEKEKIAFQAWMTESKQEFSLSTYYYYDAALVLRYAIEKLFRSTYQIQHTNASIPKRDCRESTPLPIFGRALLGKVMKEIHVKNGATGNIEYQDGSRKNFDLNITQITARGYIRIGTWSNGIQYLEPFPGKDNPTTLPLIQNGKLRVVTIISAPYMMLRKSENGSSYSGNDRFVGYLKDMIDLMVQELNVEYELYLVEDGIYGKYEKTQGKWTGIIGEIIQGKADLGLADLIITGQRQRVVEFTDPYEMIGVSLVMKNPKSIRASSSMFFFVNAFTVDVWVCILIAVLVFGVLFHVITKFTGAPDSIESASGIWGRKHAIIVNAWFSVGSSLMQGTGVYPRSISSRVLTGVFWCFILILTSMFIASITAQLRTGMQLGENNPQLSQLKYLPMESIISESVSRGWPKIGVIDQSMTASFMQSSKLPSFMKYAEYLDKNPDVKVDTAEEGLKRVRESAGNYALLMESQGSDYAMRQKPCDIVTTHDAINYAAFGLVTPLGSQLTSEINEALNVIQNKGALGSLHRKWWIESSQCKNHIERGGNERTIHVFTGLLCVTAVGFFVILIVFGIQYFRKNQNKESRRQQLSFEDMNLGQSFPTPPPELLAEPAPMLNLPEYDRKTLL